MPGIRHKEQHSTRPAPVPVPPPMDTAMPPQLARVARAIIAALLTLGPLLVFPPNWGVYNSIETPRRLLLWLGTGLLLGLILQAWAMRGHLRWRRHPLDLPVGLYLLAGVLSGIGAIYPQVTFFGPLWVLDGIQLLLIAVTLYFGIKEFVTTPEEVGQAITLMLSTGVVVAVLGLTDFLLARLTGAGLGFNPAFTGKRLVGTLGNPMFTGTYLAALIPLGIGAALATTSPRRRLSLLAGTAVLLPALLLTMARAAWVGLAMSLMLLLGLAAWRLHAQITPAVRRNAALALVAGLLLIAGMCQVKDVRDRLGSVINMSGGTVQTRRVYMQGALNMFIHRPITGWGIGNVRLVFPQYRPSSAAKEMDMPLNRGYATALPHNLPLQIGAEMGLLGLIPFGWMLFLLFRHGTRLLTEKPGTAGLAFGLLGLCATYLFSNLFAFDNSATLLLFWASLALLATLTAEERPLPEHCGLLARPLSRRLRSVVSIASLVLMLGVGVNTALQAAAAYYAYRGVNLTARTGELVNARNPRAAQVCQQALANIQRSMMLTPLPFGRNGIHYGCHVHYEMLLAARQGQVFTSAEEEDALFARDAMFAAGNQALTLVDRDPLVLRRLAMEHIDWEEYAEAQRCVEKLLSCEPNSAEVRMLASHLYEAQGYLADAVREARRAATLDPTFPAALAVCGHAYNMLAQQQTMEGKPDALLAFQQSNRYFAAAEKLGLQLETDHQLEYATGLLLTGEQERALVAGRALREEPQALALFSDSVRRLFTYQKRPAEADRFLARLRQTPAR